MITGTSRKQSFVEKNLWCCINPVQAWGKHQPGTTTVKQTKTDANTVFSSWNNLVVFHTIPASKHNAQAAKRPNPGNVQFTSESGCKRKLVVKSRMRQNIVNCYHAEGGKPPELRT